MTWRACKLKNSKFTQNPLHRNRKHPVLPHDSGVFVLAKFFQNIFAPAQNLPWNHLKTPASALQNHPKIL